MWVWDQSAGELSRGGDVVGRGYSGNGRGFNNPSMQDARGVGPIPRGRWRMTEVRTSANTGPYTIVLVPEGDTDTRGRSTFRVHGDSIAKPGTASHGCIILPRKLRERLWGSGDHLIEVVA